MKLAWLTDIHLNFIDADARGVFYQKIVKSNCDAVLISGDTAEAPNLVSLLQEMAEQINKPIYFVLGNHDYYHSEVDAVREVMRNLSDKHFWLRWLPANKLQQLTPQTILLGQDGWADGRFGDYHHSKVNLNDSRLIGDLFQARLMGRSALLQKMQQLADEDAARLSDGLLKAAELKPRQIIVLTHVPPFEETCLYQGQPSSSHFLPYFGSKIMGDVLLLVAQANPAIDYLVLCGHTHEAAFYQPLPNLTIKVGGAEYGWPMFQEIVIS
jgi:predicted MPP superfamily phosphohydrolase